MKAVVIYGRGKGLVEIREIPEPTPRDDEVLIEVKAISVCPPTEAPPTEAPTGVVPTSASTEVPTVAPTAAPTETPPTP